VTQPVFSVSEKRILIWGFAFLFSNNSLLLPFIPKRINFASSFLTVTLMLVPAMTLPEIRKEILKDLVIVSRKIVYASEKIEKDFRRQHLKASSRFVDYVSTQKNSWMFFYEYDHKKMKVTIMVYFYGLNGLTAITVEPKTEMLHYHTAHFFKRYNERRHLGLVKPEDILRTYLIDTNQISYQPLDKIASYIYKIFGVNKTGIVLGYTNTRLNMLMLNTYITHDMLKGQQLKMEDYLSVRLSSYRPDFVTAE
jgi:hypothetical protein